MTGRIVFTGIGIVTPLGNNLTEVWEKIMECRSAAIAHNDMAEMGFQNPVACRVSLPDNTLFDRGKQMTLEAVKNALLFAEIDLANKRPGIFLGSTIGESLAFERTAEGTKIDKEALSMAFFSDAIQEEFSISGICRNYGTACAAGNYAIQAAADELRYNNIDVAIAGAVDPFSRIAFAGFQRSRAMASDGVCRPFDKNRKGMLLGEGAAFFILEREEDVLKRKGQPLAVAGACGLTCDAYHPTAPHPDGSGMQASMQKALAKQKLNPDEVDWICAHGSGTILSDAAEGKAIKNVFQEHYIPVSGLKGAFGHSLAAATAIEAAICILSLQHQCIPPSINFQEMDPGIQINVINIPLVKNIEWILNCGYAFGGLNSSLLIGKWN